MKGFVELLSQIVSKLLKTKINIERSNAVVKLMQHLQNNDFCISNITTTCL